jgi:hypothetical protein
MFVVNARTKPQNRTEFPQCDFMLGKWTTADALDDKSRTKRQL